MLWSLDRSPASRGLGLADPGDIGCSPYLEDEYGVLVFVPGACFPIGWGSVGTRTRPMRAPA